MYLRIPTGTECRAVPRAKMPTKTYHPYGLYDTGWGNVGDFCLNLSDAINECVDAMDKGHIADYYVECVERDPDTGRAECANTVTEEGRAIARQWLNDRGDEVPSWLEAV